jgi:hypothetical protein
VRSQSQEARPIKSSPFSEEQVRLHVSTGSPLAELFLIDHTFALVDRSLGELDTQVKQGVYKLKARLGDTTVERLVVLKGDQTIDLTSDLPLTSAAPLENSSKTHEFHMYPAAAESSQVSTHAGTGARIFLCARRWGSGQATEPNLGPRPLPPMSLHRLDGEELAELAAPPGFLMDAREPIFGMTVEVDPGSYVLRWRDDSGIDAEQTVHAVRDWQVQVFLIEEAARGATGAAPTQRMSILMGRDRFDPADATLRLVEEARVALAEERKVASEFVTETLFAKFDNPMLGLFGAHLMLIGRDADRAAKEDAKRGLSDSKRVYAPMAFDQSLFDGVVGNLINLLGRDHPDATALATQASNQGLQNLPPVEVPPMLWKSWVLLIHASNERPQLVPKAAWRRALGVLPMRPFLVWSPQDDKEATARDWKRKARHNLPRGSTVTDGERGAVADGLSGPGGGTENVVADEVRQRLSLELLAPRAVIDEVAGPGPG